MKKEGHPDYQDILFIDTATGSKFVCGSTLKPKETQEHNGTTYPVSYLSVSSASHPFFTGSQQFVDSEGRIDKFLKKYQTKKPVQKKEEEEPPKGKAKKGKK
ncbi:MAG: type B 50S ribosomal protein L31 [Simkaniaceae bacterium]|nr:type B 50S ribosomal protein L31 [Simkaniaceae bacterium]